MSHFERHFFKTLSIKLLDRLPGVAPRPSIRSIMLLDWSPPRPQIPSIYLVLLISPPISLIFGVILYHFGLILVSFWFHFGIIFIILVSFWSPACQDAASFLIFFLLILSFFSYFPSFSPLRSQLRNLSSVHCPNQTAT